MNADSVQRVSNDEGTAGSQAGGLKKKGSVATANANIKLQNQNYGDVALNTSSYMTGSTNGQHGPGVTSPANMTTTQKKTLNMSNHQGQLGMAHNVIQYDSMIDEKRD